MASKEEFKVGDRVWWTDDNGTRWGARVVELRKHPYSAFVAFDTVEGVSLANTPLNRWLTAMYLTRNVGGRPSGTTRVPAPEPTPPAVERVVAAVVAAEMEKQNLTWTVLCDRAGISRSSLARAIDSNGGDMRIQLLEQLAAALGISPQKFWAAR